MHPNQVLSADVILADSVVTAEGKLYIQGAGWNVIWSAQPEFRWARLGIGVVVCVPWGATNQQHTLRLQIQDEDGKPVPLGEQPPNLPPGANEDDFADGNMIAVSAAFNVGRPPAISAGADQLVPLAMNFDGLLFRGWGGYRVALWLDGTESEEATARFWVQPVPGS